MPLRVKFVRNRRGTYQAALVTQQRVAFEKFLDFAQKKTTLSRTDLVAALNEAAEWILQCAEDGKICDLGPLGGSRISALGGYDELPKRLVRGENIDFKLTWILSADVRRRFRGSKQTVVRFIDPPDNPVLVSVRVVLEDGRVAEKGWQPGAILMIDGNHLKFDPQRADEGVFLIGATPSVIHRCLAYSTVHPRQIVCQVPSDLKPDGTLKLLVQRRDTSGRLLYATAEDELSPIPQDPALPSRRQAALRSGSPAPTIRCLPKPPSDGDSPTTARRPT